ncbi:Hypothetical predicted protein [Paramuricea clavata]|uniref:Uncharacterized protein n=1 Tax=Paramuricea clavata TaxID=317549 RepID=A0A6S7HDW6_PARCT|nr:Hypothetical predicted protein [Paramuricea clavata]
MALRKSQRQKHAKRMLLFFGSDQTTSILEMSKIIKYLEGDRLVEGASVLVKYGKGDLEVRVVKLHDDPSLLREAQDDFVLSQDFLEDDSVDKENLPASPEPKDRRCPPKRKNPTRKPLRNNQSQRSQNRCKHEDNISVLEKQILESGEFLFNSDPIYAFDNDNIEDSGLFYHLLLKFQTF